MKSIRVSRRLKSDRLPELRPFIGQKVNILVLAEGTAKQNKKPKAIKFEDMLGGWPEDELNDGFEVWNEAERKKNQIRSLD